MFSLSCTVSAVNISRLAIIPACLLLASCSGADALGPHPNKEILGLAQQAEADARSLADDPAAARLRSDQADQLYGEIARLCGTDPAGEPPKSCAVDRGTGDASGSRYVTSLSHDAPAEAARAAAVLPRDSVDMVVAQAVDAAAVAPVEFPAVKVDNKSDLDAAREMLRREYAAEYALSLANSYADADTRARIGALRGAGEKRRTYLTGLLGGSGPVPVPAAGYEVGAADEPTDAESAVRLVEDSASSLVAGWRRTAADASSETWMEAAIALAAQAQRG